MLKGYTAFYKKIDRLWFFNEFCKYFNTVLPRVFVTTETRALMQM